jgi:hypothetical protein
VPRPHPGRGPRRPLFDFPRVDPAGPVFVGSPWRATAVQLAGRAVVASVVVLMALLVTGLMARSVSDPGPPPKPAPAAAMADVR